MCVWNVVEGDRMCEYCSYYGGCEVRERVAPIGDVGDRYVSVLSSLVGRNIRERSRDRLVVWARNMAFYQLVMDGYSLKKIGKFMGFNHTTVIHARKQVETMLEFPTMYKEETVIWLKFQKSIESC